jgi:hypothetical protein
MRTRALVLLFAAALVGACGDGSPSTTPDTDPGPGPPGEAAPLDEAVVGAEIVDAAAVLPPSTSGDDRDQVRAVLGVPDAFILAFEPGPDGSTQRREEWYYLERQTGFEFVDGRVLTLLPLEAPGSPLGAEGTGISFVPSFYDPQDFDRAMSVDDVVAMLTDPSSLVSTPAPDELEVELHVYAADQILFAFDAEGLAYVETVPLTVEEAP